MICKTCKKDLDLSHFTVSDKTGNILKNCNICNEKNKAHKQRWNDKNRHRINEWQRIRARTLCLRCSLVKTKENTKISSHTGKLHTLCNNCLPKQKIDTINHKKIKKVVPIKKELTDLELDMISEKAIKKIMITREDYSYVPSTWNITF